MVKKSTYLNRIRRTINPAMGKRPLKTGLAFRIVVKKIGRICKRVVRAMSQVKEA